MGIKCSLFGGPHCIFNALLLPLPHKQRELSEEQARSPCSEQSSLDIWSSPTFLDPPWFISAQRRNKRGSSMSKRKMRRCFFFCYLKLNYFEFEWRENCTRQFFGKTWSWPDFQRRFSPLDTCDLTLVSWPGNNPAHRACSSRRINYVWKEEASNFQCTNTLFALSFVFVLLLRGLSTLLHFTLLLAFVIPGENQCFLFPHILRFFFSDMPNFL